MDFRRRFKLWCSNSAFQLNYTPFLLVITEVRRRQWQKMTSNLIRYNYPFLYLHPPDPRAIVLSHTLQTMHTAPSFGRKSLLWCWCLLAVNGPYGKWRGSSFDTISFNRSLGATCLNTLCTLAPSRIVCHLLWTFKADSNCGGGAGCGALCVI